MFKLEKTAAIANILLVDDVPENLVELFEKWYENKKKEERATYTFIFLKK